MRQIKLDGRYKAYKLYGYKHCLAIPATEWRNYYAVKTLAVRMFGDSTEMFRNFIWREDQALLRVAAWAYHYKNTRKTTYIYFREAEHMQHTLVMYALTNNEIQS